MSAPVGPLWTDATSPSVNALVATLPALIFSILGLLTMIGFTIIVEGKKVDNQHMLMLAEKIHKGAVDFLKTEYKFLAVFVLGIFVVLRHAPYFVATDSRLNRAAHMHMHPHSPVRVF